MMHFKIGSLKGLRKLHLRVYFWTSLLPRDPASPVWRKSAFGWHMGAICTFVFCTSSVVLCLYVVCSAVTEISTVYSGRWRRPGQIKLLCRVWTTSSLWQTDHCSVNVSLTVCRRLWYFPGKVTTNNQCASLVLQQMRGLSINSDLTDIYSTWK